MSALTPLGIVHTAISLVAVGAGVRAFFRYRGITAATPTGLVYIGMTILSCATSLFIFEHGGFGKPHALALMTLLVIGIAAAARWTNLFGRAALGVETVAYSLTFFFHMIPGVTETSTRLPRGEPLVANADAPELQVVAGVLFLVFLIGATIQVRRLRAAGNGRHPPGMRV